MIKQKHSIERPPSPMSVPEKVLRIDEIHIVSSGEDIDRIDTVELLITNIQGNRLPYPLLASFKTPESLKDFIEELIGYRNAVGSDAEPINPDAELEEGTV